jgi:nitrile hydratase accessory protein
MNVDPSVLPAGLPRDGEEPVFREPWEAEVFALAVRLQEQGLFTWDEWARTLGEVITQAQQAGDPDLGDTYYEHWTAALERILGRTGTLAPVDIDRRTDRWRRAYLATPHGHPVELSAAEE